MGDADDYSSLMEWSFKFRVASLYSNLITDFAVLAAVTGTMTWLIVKRRTKALTCKFMVAMVLFFTM